MILKKYKNQLFQTLKESPIGIDNFEMVDDDETIILKIKNTPFQFVIKATTSNLHRFSTEYTKFLKTFPLIDRSRGTEDFHTTLIFLNEWLTDEVQEYLNEQRDIDLWKEFQKGQTILNIQAIDFDDKTFFSVDEKAQIRLAINDLKLLIQKQFQTTELEQGAIIERLDYLIEASSRLNKFDWKSLAINTIISISITLTLDADKGQQLFELFKKVFKIIPQLFLQG